MLIGVERGGLARFEHDRRNTDLFLPNFRFNRLRRQEAAASR